MNYKMYVVKREAYRLIKEEIKDKKVELKNLLLHFGYSPDVEINKCVEQAVPCFQALFKDPEGKEDPIIVEVFWDGNKEYYHLSNWAEINPHALAILYSNGYHYYKDNLIDYMNKTLNKDAFTAQTKSQKQKHGSLINTPVPRKYKVDDRLVYFYYNNETGITLSRYVLKDAKEVMIPSEINGEPVTVIGKECFAGHEEITSVSFPETLTEIEEFAFPLCKGISELIIPDSVSRIGMHAFRDCKGLRKIVLPSNLKTLEAGTFCFCYLPRETEIILKEGLETIEYGIFNSGLASFLTLNLPKSVKNIARGAFVPGMTINTSLPYDIGWFMPWPYGETVLLKKEKGKVTDIKSVPGYPYKILSIMFSSHTDDLFYPFEEKSGYSFENEDNKRRLLEDLKDENVDLVRRAWQRGLI